MPAHPASAQAQAFTPQVILMALRRWWMFALPVGIVLASAAAGVVWYQFVPEYRASAQIQIDSRRPVIAFDTEGPSYGRDNGYVATQLNLLGSNIVLLGSSAYLKQPGAKSVVEKLLNGDISGWERVEAQDKELVASRNLDPSSRQVFLAGWLSKKIEVREAGKGSSIYSVSFTSRDADFSQSIVNAIVQTYFDILKAQRGEKDQDLLKLLREERDRRRPELEKKEGDLKKLIADEMRTGSFVELSPEAGDPRLAMRAQFLEAELEKAVITAEANSLTRATGSPLEISDDRVDRAIDQDPYVLALANQMRELARFLAGLDSAAASENNPESRRIRGQIDVIVKQLNAYRDEIRPQIRQDLLAAEQQSRAAALATVAARQKNNEAVIAALKEQQNKIFDDLTAGSSASLDIARRKFELELERDVLARIENRIVQLETESAAPPQEELWRWADKPVNPLVDLPYKHWLITVLPALLAPFLLAVGWERFLQRVHSPEALEKSLNLEVMGEIARFPNKISVAPTASSRGLDDALRLFEESVDTLGTSLRLAEDLRHIHVLAVTSASSHEGKTSVAAQLAVSISNATKEKTLLVDGDMRSPDIHRIFGVDAEPGLEDILNGDCELYEAIVTDWSENLHILPAGKLGVNPHRLLANGTARDLFAILARQYRYVIVDTPPVLAAGESLILCEAADATLMCAMWDVTRADQVRRACKKLAMAGVQTTGTILNGVPASRYRYRYGKYHAYT
jgi:capsular exopolysaccharide synthesis family protein